MLQSVQTENSQDRTNQTGRGYQMKKIVIVDAVSAGYNYVEDVWRRGTAVHTPFPDRCTAAEHEGRSNRDKSGQISTVLLALLI